MPKTEQIKQQFEADLKKIEDAISYSSLSNLRSDLAKVVADTKANAAKHLDALEQANSKADKALDPLIEQAQRSRYTPLYVAFLFLSGVVAGIGIGIHLL